MRVQYADTALQKSFKARIRTGRELRAAQSELAMHASKTADAVGVE